MNALLARLSAPGGGTAHGRLRTDLAGAAAAFVAAAVLANLVQEFTAFEWSLWATQAILALSLTLVWGQGGIFSLGQAAIYGIGGYTYGFWAINFADNTGETITAVVAAVVVGSIFAALLGYFMFYGNVTDVYVAIITLATSLVLFAFVNSTSGTAYRIGDAPFGGYNGMTRIPRLTWRLPGADSHVLTRTQFFLVCVAAGLLIAVIIRVIARRPFGRIAVALQHNELRTELLGYDVRWHKLALFTIGGAIAGLAGALFAAWGRFISPPVFSLAPAALVVIWVLVGGRTSVAGAIVGVLVVKGFSSWFGGASGDNEPIVLGLLLIVIVLALPGGIVTGLGRVRIWSRNRLAGSARQLAHQGVVARDGAGGQRGTGATALRDAIEQPARRIAARDVTRRFGGLAAVDDVTLEFPPRGVSCLIGPNGAGKSTLLALLSGQLRATSGSVTLDDHDLTKWHPYRRARSGIGIKLQVASIYKTLTARENLWLACYAKARTVESARNRSADLLEWLGLSDDAERPAGTLSHGQQQWLEIGMVVAGDPGIVLLDEPTAGMTRDETERTASLVTELGEQASVIVVEHDMEFVRQLGAPVTVLHMGSVFAQGTFGELSDDERIIDIYLGGSHADAASD
ncbi:ATP-binding cassette domain-containing protein [Candidatus Poriferisodalis sp.]|uniref:ATP-binding cassette domain-containing protein n=1 Tax=Candidatus Poriferisodalis sp. TaxID=3101277 RepID=UPI003C7039D6